LEAGGAYETKANSLELLVVTDGGVLINNSLVLKRGEAVAVMARENYHIQASGHCTLFKAFVPNE
jgi:mannose-6-phosphate isomerase